MPEVPGRQGSVRIALIHFPDAETDRVLEFPLLLELKHSWPLSPRALHGALSSWSNVV